MFNKICSDYGLLIQVVKMGLYILNIWKCMPYYLQDDFGSKEYFLKYNCSHLNMH